LPAELGAELSSPSLVANPWCFLSFLTMDMGKEMSAAVAVVVNGSRCAHVEVHALKQVAFLESCQASYRLCI
jgi:hypothetical protein